jgi:tRNA pseudouridine55 synthase
MNPMNGVLLIDKPTGLTSHDVVYQVRRTLGIRGIGHAGTLDPLADGLLVLLVGEATKVSDYLLNGDKGYHVTVRLGISTDSMDSTGKVLREREVTCDDARIQAAVQSLQGDLALQVPVHSAVKVDGKKLYEFAHRGQTPPSEIPVRKMHFYGIELEGREEPASIRVRLQCSKGSFVRAWANHLGEELGCGGTVSALRRWRSTPYDVGQAITLETLTERWEARSESHGSALGNAWVPLADSLPHFRRLQVSGHDEVLLRNGQISKGLQVQLLHLIQIDQPIPPVRVVSSDTDDLVALLIGEPGQFYKIKRVFNKS